MSESNAPTCPVCENTITEYESRQSVDGLCPHCGAKVRHRIETKHDRSKPEQTTLGATAARAQSNQLMSKNTDRSTGNVEAAGPLVTHEQDPDDNEYATPPKLWRPLARAVGGFDVDPASGAESTPIAPTRHTKADDGLSKAWHGWVFCNPPWSTNGDGSAKDRWLRKARNESNREDVDGVVVLLPADTSAHWFHEHLLAAEALCLVGPGRIPFEGEDRNPSFQMAIAVYGDVPNDLVDALGVLGAVIRGRQVVDPTPQAALVSDGGTSTNHDHYE